MEADLFHDVDLAQISSSATLNERHISSQAHADNFSLCQIFSLYDLCGHSLKVNVQGSQLLLRQRFFSQRIVCGMFQKTPPPTELLWGMNSSIVLFYNINELTYLLSYVVSP